MPQTGSLCYALTLWHYWRTNVFWQTVLYVIRLPRVLDAGQDSSVFAFRVHSRVLQGVLMQPHMPCCGPVGIKFMASVSALLVHVHLAAVSSC